MPVLVAMRVRSSVATAGAMPTVLRSGSYRLFFYSSDRSEPPHVHVERSECTAKVWLSPVRIAHDGEMSASELRRVLKLVERHRAELLRSWNEFFEH